MIRLFLQGNNQQYQVIKPQCQIKRLVETFLIIKFKQNLKNSCIRGQNIVSKFTKLSKTGVSLEWFTADFFAII